MSPYGGILFFGILAIVLLPAALLGLSGRPLRGYGFAATLLLLLTAFDTWQARLSLLAFWLLQTAVVYGYRRLRRVCPGKWLFWVALALSLAPLILVKLSALLPPLRLFALLGVSYMTFRAVQVLIDLSDGAEYPLNLLDFSYFLLFFPSISSGPIDRARRFIGDLHAPPDPARYRELLREGVWKLMTGALYNFALGNLIFGLFLSKLPEHGLLPNLGYLYGYTLFMFFNFAGYSRMAIGTAYILGIRQPENFQLPFLSCDMKEFWSRWHISLSTWLRDYVYTRFCLTALRRDWFKNRRTSSYVGYFLTMFLMGIWHGLSLSCLVYGLYHGLLMALNELLDTRSKRFKKWKKQPVPRAVMTLVTFHLFAFGLYIFSGRLF